MIYILHAASGGPIKIGETGSISDRVAVLHNLFPYPIEVIASFEGGRREERFIHECFKPVRIKGIVSNEWFSSCPEIWRLILDVIDNGKPSFLPDDLSSNDNTEASRLATKLFGGEREAMDSLGYSRATPSKGVFSSTCGVAGGIWPRLLFEDALRCGRLPSYVADMHKSADGADIYPNDFLSLEATQ